MELTCEEALVSTNNTYMLPRVNLPVRAKRAIMVMLYRYSIDEIKCNVGER